MKKLWIIVSVLLLCACGAKSKPEQKEEKKKEETKTVKRKHLNDYSTKELKERLEEAVRTEAYEKAALIQQELKKREQKQG